jgi:amino acid transporter
VFAAHLAAVLHWETNPWNLTLLSAGMVGTVMLINLWGIRESMVASVGITVIEVLGLMIVIAVGVAAVSRGDADLSRSISFDPPTDQAKVVALLAATSLAFFAMVGFEDSVNLAEETRDPSRSYPRAMLGALAITASTYVLVSIFAVAVVPPAALAGSETPLMVVVVRGVPGFPAHDIFAVITMCALAHTTLLNMLTASRLVYGMAKHGVLPRALSGVLPVRRTPWSAILTTSVIAVVLVSYVAHIGSGGIGLLAGTTSLLHLAVFAFVNVTVLILRSRPVAHPHFRTSATLAAGAAVVCTVLTTPLTGRDPRQYALAGALLAVGMALALPALRPISRTGRSPR